MTVHQVAAEIASAARRGVWSFSGTTRGASMLRGDPKPIDDTTFSIEARDGTLYKVRVEPIAPTELG